VRRGLSPLGAGDLDGGASATDEWGCLRQVWAVRPLLRRRAGGDPDYRG